MGIKNLVAQLSLGFYNMMHAFHGLDSFDESYNIKIEELNIRKETPSFHSHLRHSLELNLYPRYFEGTERNST